MTRILHLETSTDVCSVCLSEGDTIVQLKETIVANSHSSLLTIFIRDCMADAGWSYSGLDAIAASSGPGSYTSLRIGGSTAKGLCYGANLPFIAIDSLSVLAEGINSQMILPDDYIIPMIDARRMEVYSAVYNAKRMQIEPVKAVILEEASFSQLFKSGNSVHICGNGATKFHELLDPNAVQCHHTRTSAQFMPGLALRAFEQSKFTEISSYSPEYFKGPHITETKKKFF